MRIDESVQHSVFKTIKALLPNHISLVHEISELLGISYDSAYRRIRGQKPLSLEESNILCSHFNIPIENFINPDRKSVLFQPLIIHEDNFGFKGWFSLMQKEIQRVQASKHKEVIYAARDLPIYYYFDFPELIAFKFYFWQKILLRFSEFQGKQFSFNDVDTRNIETGRQLLSAYNLIPSIEIWNNETFSRIMRQIEFCWESGFFSNKNDALRICDVMVIFINHMQKQVESGLKFNYGADAIGIEESYKVYINEVLLSDNTVLIVTDTVKVTYMAYNTLNLMMTDNNDFCDQIGHSLKNLMKSASFISGTSAKERNRFFAGVIKETHKLRETIEK